MKIFPEIVFCYVKFTQITPVWSNFEFSATLTFEENELFIKRINFASIIMLLLANVVSDNCSKIFTKSGTYCAMQMTLGISEAYCDKQWCFDLYCVCQLVAFVQFVMSLYRLLDPGRCFKCFGAHSQFRGQFVIF